MRPRRVGWQPGVHVGVEPSWQAQLVFSVVASAAASQRDSVALPHTESAPAPAYAALARVIVTRVR